jgi:hypothetical protein
MASAGKTQRHIKPISQAGTLVMMFLQAKLLTLKVDPKRQLIAENSSRRK